MRHPTNRIPQDQSFFFCSFFSVTNRGPPLYLGNREWYHRSAGVKTTGKKFWNKSAKKSKNFKMLTSYKCLNSQILGLVGFFKNSRNTMGVVYFRKALRTSTSKMMIPGVKFKIVKNLISVSTPKFWGWLGFFKNSQNTMGVVYFRKALGKSTLKMMIPGVKFKIVTKLISVSTLKFWGWLGF